MKVLFLITARGGSKGVPGKNLKQIGGLSLVGYKALSAKKSRYCSRLIISSDSAEIQEEARRHGAEVPFTRPSELATDTAQSSAVISHAMDWIEREGRERYDALMLLEPSSPFALGSDYDAALDMLVARNANAVVGMRRMEVGSDVIGTLDDNGRITSIIDKLHAGRRNTGQRQLRSPEYTMNGALYAIRWEYFRRHGWIYHDRESVYGHVMDRFRSVEIDDPVDLAWAEHLVASGLVPASEWKP